MKSISFKRLLEISEGSAMDSSEEEELTRKNAVYIIYNDLLNKIYIGETDDVYIRLFSFWKEDKRHVTGSNAPINRKFNSDYENTYFKVVEYNCKNTEREYYWHDYYRDKYNYVIISHPGRHACTESGNKGLKAINKDGIQTYVSPKDIQLFLNDGWSLGGNLQSPRTDDQKLKMSISHLKKIPWNKGISLTEEQKSHYRGIKKNIINKRTFSVEQLNVLSKINIGRVKIHKNLIEKQVLKGEVDSYLSNGWILGVVKKMVRVLDDNGRKIELRKSSWSRYHKNWILIEEFLSD